MYNSKFVLSDGKEIYPGYFGKEDRQALLKEFKDKKHFMRCGCRSDVSLYYRISENLHIYPEHNNYQHDMFCCRYKDGSGKQERRTAYVINEENGDVVAFTSFNPLDIPGKEEDDQKEQDNIVPGDENETMEEMVIEQDEGEIVPSEKKEPKLSVDSLVRSINVDSFTERVLNNRKIVSKEKFSAAVYYRMKKVRLARTKKNIGELTLEKDGCKFLYLSFAGVIRKEENGGERCYVQSKAPDGKIYNYFIFPDTLEKAMKKFIKTYGIMPNEHTMMAGFQYLKKSRTGHSYKVMGRLHIFQTSDLGLYCRSKTEVNAFNQLQEIADRNEDITYWVPPEDEYVGAIIQVKGASKKILVLFRSKKAEHVTYDKTMYVPFVAGKGTQIKEEQLIELAGKS